MKRTDADGHQSNMFFDGNPAGGIKATVLEQTWLNNVQEEIATLIEAEGITLDGGDQTQLRDAIQLMISGGGGSAAQVNEDILNAQTNEDIAGLLFDKTLLQAAVIEFSLERRSDSSNVQEMGHMFVAHDTNDDTWRISVSSNLDDAGVTFNITSAGQVQYTSDTLAGANYAGKIRAQKRTLSQ